MADRGELQQRNLEAMDAGRDASVVASIVTPLINNRITSYVQQLAGMYRGGQMTHDQMLGKVAEIAAMLNLISDLESTQRRADIAAEKELGHGPQT